MIPIYHINVNPYKNLFEPLRQPDIPTIFWWKPNSTIKKVIIDLYSIFYFHTLSSPKSLNSIEYLNNKSLFELKARYFTKKYANPINDICKKNSDERWKFDFNDEDLNSVNPIKTKKEMHNNDYDNNFINIIFNEEFKIGYLNEENNNIVAISNIELKKEAIDLQIKYFALENKHDIIEKLEK